MSLFNRNDILKDLRNNVIEVTFIKENNQPRILRCTLKPEFLPERYKDEKHLEEQFHETNMEIIRAWDIQNGGWRSFHIESVLHLHAIDSY
jgi:hypothetical protein